MADGFKPILAAGMFFTALGLLWFSQVSVDGSYLGDILFPSMIAGLGLGLSFPGATVGGTSGVREDEAGLASGLTGEGIHPALISGRAVARMILDPAASTRALDLLVHHHRRHRRFVALAGGRRRLCGLLMETLVVLLRLKMLDFRALEMAR